MAGPEEAELITTKETEEPSSPNIIFKKINRNRENGSSSSGLADNRDTKGDQFPSRSQSDMQATESATKSSSGLLKNSAESSSLDMAVLFKNEEPEVSAGKDGVDDDGDNRTARDGGQRAKPESDVEAWYNNLPPEHQQVVDQGIEAMFHQGCMMALQRSYNTVVNQNRQNKKDAAARKKQNKKSRREREREREREQRWQRERDARESFPPAIQGPAGMHAAPPHGPPAGPNHPHGHPSFGMFGGDRPGFHLHGPPLHPGRPPHHVYGYGHGPPPGHPQHPVRGPPHSHGPPPPHGGPMLPPPPGAHHGSHHAPHGHRMEPGGLGPPPPGHGPHPHGQGFVNDPYFGSSGRFGNRPGMRPITRNSIHSRRGPEHVSENIHMSGPRRQYRSASQEDFPDKDNNKSTKNNVSGHGPSTHPPFSSDNRERRDLSRRRRSPSLEDRASRHRSRRSSSSRGSRERRRDEYHHSSSGDLDKRFSRHGSRSRSPSPRYGMNADVNTGGRQHQDRMQSNINNNSQTSNQKKEAGNVDLDRNRVQEMPRHQKRTRRSERDGREHKNSRRDRDASPDRRRRRRSPSSSAGSYRERRSSRKRGKRHRAEDSSEDGSKHEDDDSYYNDRTRTTRSHRHRSESSASDDSRDHRRTRSRRSKRRKKRHHHHRSSSSSRSASDRKQSSRKRHKRDHSRKDKDREREKEKESEVSTGALALGVINGEDNSSNCEKKFIVNDLAGGK